MTMQALPLPAGDRETMRDATQIAPFVHAEASVLATAMLGRFLALLESLAPEEWERPTYCTAWTVRDIVAHQAGSYESGTSFAAFRRQWLAQPLRGPAQLDDVNARQIEERKGRTPAQLIAELRAAGPRAIAARSRYPLLVRSIPIPIPPLGLRRAGYLTDELYVRDTFIHTIDIAHAAGKPLALALEADRRIVERIVQDLAERLPAALAGDSVVFDLTGAGGGAFRIGEGRTPAATIRMDVVDFNLRASDRISAAEAIGRSEITGDGALGRRALEHTFVVY